MLLVDFTSIEFDEEVLVMVPLNSLSGEMPSQVNVVGF
jgi:hypothetical protein